MPASRKTTLVAFLKYCTIHKLPVACYRLPHETVVKVVAQKHTSLKILQPHTQHIYEKGFIYAPFTENRHFSKFIITPDIFTTEAKLPVLNIASNTDNQKALTPGKVKLKESGKKSYMHYVQKITRAIRKGKFDKVVAARVVKSAKPENFNPALFFKKLCRKYPNAFVSLVYTPQFGLWIGASPEILLQVDGKGFKTYSLAGTQAATGNKQIVWGEKEKEEQKIVSDYITSSFKNITTDTPLITGPETVAAGNLLHLRTTFVYNTVPHSMWQKAVHELHPTPAVGGLPKKDAIDFILKHERAQRGYYSGYCGPVNLDRQINLFVNLRCMQVLKNKLAVYAGCGITADSVPADEWNESELKTRTLLGLL